MFDKPTIINPSWELLFRNILIVPHPDPRIDKWCRELLFPYIEKNPDEFCYKIYVQNVRAAPEESAWEGDLLIELEGMVVNTNPPNPNLNLTVMHDANIVKIDTTFDNREIHLQSMGWLDQAANHLTPRYRSDTRVSILLRGASKAILNSDMVYLFAAHSFLSDMGDWLIHGARIPLTVTKLPFKEAKRLCDEWHERTRKRKLRESERKAGTPGDRELVGRLTIAPDNNVPIETYEAHWCKDQQSLKHESMIQHHCVDMYWDRVVLSQSVIIHLQNIDPDKREDRWTVELALIRFQKLVEEDDLDDISPPRTVDSSFVAARQFRGIANRAAHPGFSTGFGNLFLTSSDGTKGKSVLFTEDSWFNAQPIIDKLTNPFGAT